MTTKSALKAVSLAPKPVRPAPYLYLLMRNDIPSLNPGKAVAQGSHAATQMIFKIELGPNPEHKEMLGDWEAQTNDGFGTAITLAGPWVEIDRIITAVSAVTGYPAGRVLDPTYPVRDGVETYFLPLHTCAWILGPPEKIKPFLTDLDLMP